MPTVRKPPVSDLNALLKGLSKARIEFILVGGIAAVVQGAPLTTFDLDIVHRQTDENIQKLMKFLESVEIEFKGHNVQVLNLEAMVALKRGTEIPKEQYQLRIYEETLRMRNENIDKV